MGPLPFPSEHFDHLPPERRADRRYSIGADVQYQLKPVTGNRNGVGRTINISSSGVLFESRCVPQVGEEISLSIAWPARLNGVVGLRLHVLGRVVRVSGNRTAMTIAHYQYRTAAASR